MDELSRGQLEEGADFLGLIIMQNLVKRETYGAISELHAADITTLMVTGDNIQTAISVGRDCQLVKTDQTIIRVEAEDGPGQLAVTYSLPESETASILTSTTQMADMTSENYVFACDGTAFRLIRNKDPELFKRIVHRGKIFARMLPEQKIELIECLKQLGRQVIMCGDGCNDCGALKTAHAGERRNIKLSCSVQSLPRYLPLYGGGLGGGAFHLPGGQHRLRPHRHQGGPGHARLRLCLFQVRGGLLLHPAHQCPHGLLCKSSDLT